MGGEGGFAVDDAWGNVCREEATGAFAGRGSLIYLEMVVMEREIE
jgi:hypothetical protein